MCLLDQSPKSPEPAVGAVSSAVAGVKPRGATPLYGFHAASRRWLSFFETAQRMQHITRIL